MMSQPALKARDEMAETAAGCDWCPGQAAVALEGRSYCGACFHWIAERKRPFGAEWGPSGDRAHFARPNASSR